MTRDADRLADATGFGEALVGAVLLGAATSLSGTVVSVTAALDARPELAFANSVGGIAAQTAFLAIADLIYRRANLEHAAAELANVFQAGVLVLMLSLVLLAVSGPDATFWGVHPVSIALPILYLASVRVTAVVRAQPMWRPVTTAETRTDAAETRPETRDVPMLAARFAMSALVLGVAGWLISKTGGAIADRAQISETAVGALMTAVATSLPELVTTIAAVRRGAVQLAVGGIIGGNSFDVLFLCAADIAYRDGSLYHAVGLEEMVWVATGLCMTAVLLLGLVLREKRGLAGIGTESALLLAIYLAAAAIQSAGPAV